MESSRSVRGDLRKPGLKPKSWLGTWLVTRESDQKVETRGTTRLVGLVSVGNQTIRRGSHKAGW